MRKLSVSIKTLQTILVVFMTLMVAACYAVAIPTKQVDSSSFYLSYVFQVDPGRAISTFSLPFIAASAYAIFLARYLYGDGITTDDSNQRLNWIKWLASWSCVGLVGLGAVTIKTFSFLHGFFAFSLFTCSTTALLLMAAEDYKVVYREMTKVLILRFASGSIALLCIFAMLYGFTANKFVASVAELIFVACITWSLTSYSKEFDSYRIELSLVKVA
jgi:Frag1/DRAM/Sfk1 family